MSSPCRTRRTTTTPTGIDHGRQRRRAASRFHQFFDDAREETVDTPYGEPSAPISIGALEGKELAFLPCHGRNHNFLPSEVPHGANLWALKKLGVRQVVSFNTVGSLHREYRKGEFVLVDQFVDRTLGRADTFFSGDIAAHVSTAYAYCDRMRHHAYGVLTRLDEFVHVNGTMVVIQGPRFSTVAESKWFNEQGWHLVNMTHFPEVVLARELELCYLNLSYVTDYDVAAREVVGDDSAEIVSHQDVIKAFNADSERVLDIIRAIVRALPAHVDCECNHALDDVRT